MVMCSCCKEPCWVVRLDDSDDTGEFWTYASECCHEAPVMVLEDGEDVTERELGWRDLKSIWEAQFNE